MEDAVAKMMRDKYMGCMVGALVGDCMGSSFERVGQRETLHVSYLDSFLKRVMDRSVKKDSFSGRGFVQDEEHDYGGYYKYTDDTAMTHVLAECLLSCKHFDPVVVAKKFAAEFFRDPILRREYGPTVRKLFPKFLHTDYNTVYWHAKSLFGGTGSRGNGATMRVAPIALFFKNRPEQYAAEMAKKQACLTHSNPLGYNAAILVTMAIRMVLDMDPTTTDTFDVRTFLNNLKAKMSRHEPVHDRFYTKILNAVMEMLDDGSVDDIDADGGKKSRESLDYYPERVAFILGNTMEASKSVPAALYAFLRATKPFSYWESDNGFVRTVYFAIAMGGDTDTIASIAASIAGAYYGLSSIPTQMMHYCQAESRALKLGNDLYEASLKPPPLRNVYSVLQQRFIQ